MKHKQTEAHDWLADCAENYVAYLGAHADFEVFGASKWGADVVFHEKKKGGWWRVEVRSTDRDKKPTKKPIRKLRGKAELLANVVFHSNAINTTIYRLRDGKKGHSIKNPTTRELRHFLMPKK